MAIYHFSARVISRSKGKSAIACSSYRAGEKLYDERYDEWRDYSHKPGVLHSEILLPKNAPERLNDRATLWNEIEKNEKRKDAQLARDLEITLPRELTFDQNLKLARNYLQDMFVSKGMIADFAYHNAHASDGESQPHIHVMLSLRELSEKGFGLKVRAWNDKQTLNHWREQWAEYTNQALARHGHDLRIDHRSFRDLGIELEPQRKVGPVSAAKRMAAYEEHQEIAGRNGERLLKRPEIILELLTHQQSTFTHHDIARMVNRYTRDADQFQLVYEKVKTSSELIHLGMDDHKRDRFTTLTLLKLETEMLENAKFLSTKYAHEVKPSVDIKAITEKHHLSKEQINVLNYISAPGDLKNVVGFAGTGKSKLLGAAKEVWETSGLRVLGASLSGIAAENLQESSGIESRTLASRFYHWDRWDNRLTPNDILVIDEAGMLGSKQIANVFEEALERGAKVICVGDPEQLQAILAGAAFRAITERTSYIEMTEVRRQRVDWQRQATVQLATQQTADALVQYDARDCIHDYATQDEAKNAVVDTWNEMRLREPDKSQLMLAFTREEVSDLNQRARSLRQNSNELGQDHLIHTERGQKPFAVNDQIYFLRNDYDLGVKNGSVGIIKEIEKTTLSVELKKENKKESEIIKFNVKDYNNIDYGYASTIHKSQGGTFDKTFILASRFFDRFLSYVALSRHRDHCEIFYSREEFKDHNEFCTLLSRERAKDVTLDYPDASHKAAEFAKYRGILPIIEKLSERIQETANILLQKTTQTICDFTTDLKTLLGINESHLKSHQERQKELADILLNPGNKSNQRENSQSSNVNHDQKTDYQQKLDKILNSPHSIESKKIEKSNEFIK